MSQKRLTLTKNRFTLGIKKIKSFLWFYLNLTGGRVNINIIKSFYLSLAKKRSRSRPKISAQAPDQILNRFRLQLKHLRSGRLRNNTGFVRLLFLITYLILLLKTKSNCIINNMPNSSSISPIIGGEAPTATHRVRFQNFYLKQKKISTSLTGCAHIW